MESSLGFNSSDFERLDTSTFNVGIYLSFSSFEMEHLVDMCCDDLSLVVDVLDTFCIQGRQRLDSLEHAIEQEDISTAVFDAMFIVGASKNIGAKPLTGAVDTVLDVVRAIVKRECLSDNPHTLRFPPCTDASERASWQCALVTAARAVRGCFDQLDLDARRAIVRILHYLMAYKDTGRASPDVQGTDAAVAQAALHAGREATFRRARHEPAIGKMHPAHRRPSEPALMTISPCVAFRRLSLPALRINAVT
jgi:HPt (histidine-containing phosphotransfer) domain-containing protein